MAKVLAKVERVTADRTNYKQYSPQLVFDDVYVEIEVPEDEMRLSTGVIGVGINGKILSLKGFTVLLDTVATAVDQMHSEYQRKFQ